MGAGPVQPWCCPRARQAGAFRPRGRGRGAGGGGTPKSLPAARLGSCQAERRRRSGERQWPVAGGTQHDVRLESVETGADGAGIWREVPDGQIDEREIWAEMGA